MNTARHDANVKTWTHEQTEMLEASEADAKTTIARVKLELAEARPPFETTLEAHRKAPKSTMKVLRDRYQFEGEELRRQREASIKEAEGQLVRSKAKIAEMEKSVEGNVKRAIAAEEKACSDACLKHGSVKSVECMIRAKAPDQVPPCLEPGAEKR